MKTIKLVQSLTDGFRQIGDDNDYTGKLNQPPVGTLFTLDELNRFHATVDGEDYSLDMIAINKNPQCWEIIE